MSRSHHVSLERSETAILGGRGRRDRQRADLEEALARALADGDRETVSRLREDLAVLGGVADD